MTLRVGIDIGSTFTDLYAYNSATGYELAVSHPTTPDDIAEGVMKVLKCSGLKPSEIEILSHSTTLATNAILNRSYPPVAFITTEGFRDLIEIGHYHRKALFDPYQQKTQPLVSRKYRFEVPERIDKNGNIIKPLDLKALLDVVEKIRTLNIKAVAIGFFNSYANSCHEDKAREILEQVLPGTYFCLSSEILPTIGAIGRFTTAIINAALYPVVSIYIADLLEQLKSLRFAGKLYMVQSNGGLNLANAYNNKPEALVGTGNTAGVIGAEYLNSFIGIENCITLDMGGTSCDIAIIEQGEPLMSKNLEVDWDMPVPIPVIDVMSIGSGGSSIAWLDEGGIIKVGPHSVGAMPGPVCYGHGNNQPTLTDVNLVLGYIDPDYFLGGKLKIDPAKSMEALKTLGYRANLDPFHAAEGILEIANVNMANNLREIITARGRDPENFVLTAFGGAGGLHAVAIGEKAGISSIMIPKHPGEFSAFGNVFMGIRHESEVTYYSPMYSLAIADLNEKFTELDTRCLDFLRQQSRYFDDFEIKHWIALRYTGQSYDLYIPAPVYKLSRNDLTAIELSFHELHERIYMVADPESLLEITGLRSSIKSNFCQATKGSREILSAESNRNKSGTVLSGTREAIFNGTKTSVPVYDRQHLKEGLVIDGPAIIREIKSTTLIPPERQCIVDDYGNLRIDFAGKE